MISELLPENCATVVATASMARLPLSKAEAAVVATASEVRRTEFQAGRAAARLALAELNLWNHDLLPATDRRPLWPAGVVGSITHTGGFCAAAVARHENYLGIGIDAERLDRPIVGAVRERICHDAELAYAPALAHAAHLIFSAKESYFKAYYPATLHWIDFLDARVTIGAADQSFRVELIAANAPRPAGLTDVVGRYRFADDMVITAVAPAVVRI